MATGIYKELTEVDSCEICCELLEGRKPRQLTCLHVFCEQCLQLLLDTGRAIDPQKSSINCPVCNSAVEIPGGSVANLPIFNVSKLQSIRKDIEDRHAICKLSAASAIAEECGSWQSHRNEDGRSVESTCAGSDVFGSFQSELAEARASLDKMSVSVKPTLLHEMETGDIIMGIDYLDNGQLIVCMPIALRVYEVNGSEIRHHLSEVCKPCNGELYSMSVDNNSKCVVVSEDRYPGRPGYLHVYRSDGVTWQYNRRDVCQRPAGVYVTSDGDCFVGSLEDYKLYKYNSRGEEVLCVDTSRYGGPRVWGLSVGVNGEIFVCFWGNVVVYDKAGREISKLTRKGRELEPGGVCVGKHGEIVVSDIESKSILLFSKTYSFIRCLIDLDFRPFWICLYNNVRLAVSGPGGKIRVYKL